MTVHGLALLVGETLVYVLPLADVGLDSAEVESEGVEGCGEHAQPELPE
jgi:hypothetical protein